MPARKSQGASRCQVATGTWNARTAATRPAAAKTAWRARKYHARWPVCDAASAIAIDDE